MDIQQTPEEHWPIVRDALRVSPSSGPVCIDVIAVRLFAKGYSNLSLNRDIAGYALGASFEDQQLFIYLPSKKGYFPTVAYDRLAELLSEVV